jgi:predicted esterase
MTANMHDNVQVYSAGALVEEASAAMIMIHGRGATADSILELAPEFEAPHVAYLAPQANNFTWYPLPFRSPIEQNEPALSSALAVINTTIQHVEASGIPAEKIMLLGFSQGACLASEFVARNARRYGGLFALSGGLIGPDDTPRDYPGSLEGTTVFLGCSDIDSHIPLPIVKETAEVMRNLGGKVTERIYPGMGHIINRDEVEFIKSHLRTMTGS